MASVDRNAEIWSTRLQREILALESSDDDSKKMELLPPFIQTLRHTLNIEGGIAKIEFRIDVEVADGGEGAPLKDETENQDTAKAENKADSADTKDATETNTEESSAEKEVATSTEGEESQESPAGTSPTDPHIILVLDASMYWKTHDSSSDQSKPPQFYPFTKPLAVVKSGSHVFSGGSTINDGDEIDIDLDWTPR